MGNAGIPSRTQNSLVCSAGAKNADDASVARHRGRYIKHMSEEKKTEGMEAPSKQEPTSDGTESRLNAFAEAVLRAVRDRGRDMPSRWHDMDAMEVYRRYLSELLPYQVITVAALIAVIVIYYMLPSDGMVPWIGQLVIAFLLLLAIDRLFTMRTRKASAGLTEVVTQDCDTGKYREILGFLDRRDALHVSSKSLAMEYARCDYMDGKPEAALKRLDAIKGKHLPLPIRVLSLNMRANACASLGRVKECEDALADLQVLGNGVRGQGFRKVISGFVESMEIRLKDPGDMTDDDAAALLKKLENEPSHVWRVSLQLMLARYLMANGHADDARLLVNDEGLEPMTDAARMAKEKLLAQLGDRQSESK